MSFSDFWDFEEVVLSNGLRIIYCHLPQRTYTHAEFLVHVGSFDGEDGKVETAHFLEHLIYHRFSKAMHAKFVALEFNSYNQNQGRTHLSATSYGFSAVTHKQLKLLVRLMSVKMLDRARELFNDDAFEKEREVLIREIHHQKIGSSWRNYDEMIDNVFQGSKHVALLDWKARLKALAGFVPGDVARLYSCYYWPSNMTVVAAGPLACDSFAKIVETGGFGVFGGAERKQFPASLPETPKPRRASIDYSESEGLKENVNTLSIGWIPKHSLTSPTLDIIEMALYNQLRYFYRQKNSFAYDFKVNIASFLDSYMFTMHCPAYPFRQKAFFLDCQKKIFGGVLPGDKKLFRRCKRALLKKLSFVETSPRAICDSVSEMLQTDGAVLSPKQSMELISSVSYDDFAKVMADIGQQSAIYFE